MIRSLKDRLRRTLNVAVAETGSRDRIRACELTVVTLGDGRAQVDSILDRADAFVVADGRVVVGPVHRELF